MSEANSKRSVNWSDKETKILMQLFKDNLVDLRRCKRNKNIYVKMGSLMEGYGCHRSSSEIRKKIENLKRKYREEKTKIGPTGGLPSSWKYYSTMHEILGSLPSMNKTCMKESLNSSLFSDFNGSRNDDDLNDAPTDHCYISSRSEGLNGNDPDIPLSPSNSLRTRVVIEGNSDIPPSNSLRTRVIVEGNSDIPPSTLNSLESNLLLDDNNNDDADPDLESQPAQATEARNSLKNKRTPLREGVDAPRQRPNALQKASEALAEAAKARQNLVEDEVTYRRREYELRMKHLEEEHNIKMEIEHAHLKNEQQKYNVLLAKEAYYKANVNK